MHFSFQKKSASCTESHQVFVFTYVLPLVVGRLGHFFGKSNIKFRKVRHASKLNGWCLHSCMVTLMHHDCNRVTFEKGPQDCSHIAKYTAGLGTQYQSSWKCLKQQLPKEKREAMGEWGCFRREDPSSSPGGRAEPLQG